MHILSETARAHVLRYVVNPDFTQAILFFQDGSSLQFEHKIGTRRAKASTDSSMADSMCRTLRLFRLNAKHLQLYFEDGSNIEFFAPESHF